MSEPKFRYRATWRGKLVLQISYRMYEPWIGMLTYWRDAKVMDLESLVAWNTRTGDPK